MPKEAYPTHAFLSVRHVTTFLDSGTLDSEATLHLGPFSMTKPPTNSTEIAKTCGTEQITKKNPCLQSENRGQEADWSLVLRQLGNVLVLVGKLKISQTYTRLKMTKNHSSVDSNRFYQQINSQIWNLRMMKIMCLCDRETDVNAVPSPSWLFIMCKELSQAAIHCVWTEMYMRSP